MSEWNIEGTDLFVQDWDTNEELSVNQANERLNHYETLLADREALVRYVRADLAYKNAVADFAPDITEVDKELHDAYEALSQELKEAINE